jgi:hypothetical protein
LPISRESAEAIYAAHVAQSSIRGQGEMTGTAVRPGSPLEDAYLPLRTLSSYSGLSIRTLRGYLSHPTHPLPCYRIGGKVLVRRSEYDAWASRFRAWWIFIDHHGKRRAKRIGDHQTAQRTAKELRERLGRVDLHLPLVRAETLTFERYSQTWLEQARLNLKASTVRFYEGHLAQHIVPALGQRAIGDLRRADCRDLVTACRTKGLKATTVRGIARTLSTSLTQAVEDELLPANPALRLGRYLRTADDAEPELRAELRLWRASSARGVAEGWAAVSRVGLCISDRDGARRIERAEGVQSVARRWRAASSRSAPDAAYVRRPVATRGRADHLREPTALGHKDSSITLRVYAHWLPDTTTSKGVDRLDDAVPSVARSLHVPSRTVLRKIA